jgi:hypothetical protein
MSSPLQDHLSKRKLGASAGIYSVCSAHPWVIRAAAEQAAAAGSLLLIEATSNQVNQFGGYTGMRPAEFRSFEAEQIPIRGALIDPSGRIEQKGIHSCVGLTVRTDGHESAASRAFQSER